MKTINVTRKLAGLGVSTILMCGALSAQASIVVPSCSIFSYACEFLEFSYTQNLSRDEVDILRYQESSALYGYSYATRYETASLLDSYFAGPITAFDTGWRPETYSAAVNFLSDFGVLNATIDSGKSNFYYGSDTETFLSDTRTYVGTVAYALANTYVPAMGYFHEESGTSGSYSATQVNDDSYDMYTASLLVKRIYPATVPVPAAVWLFGSGLIGLVGVARRKR